MFTLGTYYNTIDTHSKLQCHMQIFNVLAGYACLKLHDMNPQRQIFWRRCPYSNLSYDVASGSEITPFNKIDKPLVVYRFTGKVMTFITTLRT